MAETPKTGPGTLAEPFASAFWLRLIAAEQKLKQITIRHGAEIKVLADEVAELRTALELGKWATD